jgi:hypothetical protein
MGAVQGNCYEDNPNRKWLKMSEHHVFNAKSRVTTSNLNRRVEHAVGNQPSINIFNENDKEGQEDVETESDGRVIRGIVRGGSINSGSIEYPNGDRYQGEIWRNTAHGMGQMQSKNGDYYKGRFYKDRRDGVGELVTHNGKYNGNFRDNLFEGQGVFQFKDGSVYRGNQL